MTQDQITKVKALSGCTFQPGSYYKRFVRDLSTMQPDKELSEKQAAFLDKLYYMYRRQIAASKVWDGAKYPPLVKPKEIVRKQSETPETGETVCQ